MSENQLQLTEEQKILSQILLTHFESKEHVKQWIHVFLGFDFPDSFVDPDSNSSPIDWLWETYSAYKLNEGNIKPSTIIISSRESYKTFSQAIFAVIVMLHFGATICHMAAIVPQATAAQKYISDFFRKLGPYIAYNKKEIKTENTKEISIKNEDGSVTWMKIVVCSLSGANSSHSNILCVSGKTHLLIKPLKKNKIHRDRVKMQASKVFKLLEQGIEVEVLSYNHATGLNELKPITKWWDTGRHDDILDITLEDGTVITTTKNHKFFTKEDGYIEAENLLNKTVVRTTKQKLIKKDPIRLDVDNTPVIKYKEPQNVDDVNQVILGGLLGDSGCYRRKNYRDIKKGEAPKYVGNCYIKFNHCMKQKEYANYKRSIIEKKYPMKDFGHAKYCSDVFCRGIYGKQIKLVKVKEINKAKYNRHFYDFTVKDNNNFYANGVLAHNCIDEVDTIRGAEQVRAYNEALFIPGVFEGQFPMTIQTSTMKFPGGLFVKQMDLAKEKKWPIFKWNIIDITEKCSPDRHLPDEPREDVYVAYSLPLKTISPDKYKDLLDKDKKGYEKISAMAGCAKCPLLPVCKGRLAARNENDKGGLWKPIDFTIAQFNKLSPDLAEAQLLCRKPSSSGMVYPRFVKESGETGNILSLEEAYTTYTGEVYPKELTHKKFVEILKKNAIPVVCGVDFGTTNAFSIVAAAKMPTGEWWILESIAITGLEFDEMLKIAKDFKVRYKPRAWYADYAVPAFIKTFKRNGLNCPKFIKDVMGGIEAVRGCIVNANGDRKLKVIDCDQNKVILKMFAEHTFKLDTIGNPTEEPDDEVGIADPGDALRYIGQNVFEKIPKNSYTPVMDLPQEVPDPQKWVQVEIKKLTTPVEPVAKPKRLILDIDED